MTILTTVFRQCVAKKKVQPGFVKLHLDATHTKLQKGKSEVFGIMNIIYSQYRYKSWKNRKHKDGKALKNFAQVGCGLSTLKIFNMTEQSPEQPDLISKLALFEQMVVLDFHPLILNYSMTLRIKTAELKFDRLNSSGIFKNTSIFWAQHTCSRVLGEVFLVQTCSLSHTQHFPDKTLILTFTVAACDAADEVAIIIKLTSHRRDHFLGSNASLPAQY